MKNKVKNDNRSKKNKTDDFDHVIDAAFKLVDERGWKKLLLKDIAEETKLSLSELCKIVSSKSAILIEFQNRTDVHVIDSVSLEGSSYRDRLFEVLMCRFDIFQPYRNPIKKIITEFGCNPLTALLHGPQLFKSMALMLETAGINSSGIKGILRVKGLTFIYIHTLRIWLNDNSPDLSETMASLDRDLTNAERLIERLGPSKK